MILVALGTQKFQMDRLVKAVDDLAVGIDEEIFIQIGNTAYRPKHCKYQEFIEQDKFQEMIESCSMLVTHSGVGTIMRAKNAGKPVVVVPRLAKYNEHVDDHQVQIAEAFAEKQCVIYCEDVETLYEAIEKARTYQFQPYKVPENRVEDLILNFLETL